MTKKLKIIFDANLGELNYRDFPIGDFSVLVDVKICDFSVLVPSRSLTLFWQLDLWMRKFELIKHNYLFPEEGEPEQQSLTDEMDRLHVVSRELEDHISTIQSRIHMIKDLWKHRCGDN